MDKKNAERMKREHVKCEANAKIGPSTLVLVEMAVAFYSLIAYSLLRKLKHG